jgi:hypothetical protein
MSGEVAPVPDPLGDLSDEDLAGVRLGRNRMLAALGGALFGFATSMVARSAPALAHHGAPPWPCYGFPACHYCDGRICTQYCSWYNHSHCPSGDQCWNTCASNNILYRCCDWHERFPAQTVGHHCICRGTVSFWCT